MGKPSPPPPPDFAGAAAAQGAANVNAARIQSRFNNPNVVSPYGSQIVLYPGSPLSPSRLPEGSTPLEDLTPSELAARLLRRPAPGSDVNAQGGDPDARGVNAAFEQPTVIQTFTPQQRRIHDINLRTQEQLGNLANVGATNAQAILNDPVSFGALPSLSLPNQTNLPIRPAVQQDLQLGALPTLDSAATVRDEVIDAMMARHQQDYDRQREQTVSNLRAAGIAPGTEAYGYEMDQLDRGLNDARNQALLFAGQEASREFDIDRQQYLADLGRRTRAFDEAFSQRNRQFDDRMNLRNQAFNEQFTRRDQALREQLAQRNQLLRERFTQRQAPINEIAALLSGSQIQNPFVIPQYAQNTSVAPAPIFQAERARGQYLGDLYNAQAGLAGQQLSGLYGLGGNALLAGSLLSDRRLKTHIKRIGTHRSGLPLYRYRLFGRSEIGVMADEVRERFPHAVITVHGIDRVNYAAIGGRF